MFLMNFEANCGELRLVEQHDADGTMRVKTKAHLMRCCLVVFWGARPRSSKDPEEPRGSLYRGGDDLEEDVHRDCYVSDVGGLAAVG